MGHNCLGRAYLLAKVLSRRYEVEVLGSQFPVHGKKIWKPCDTGEFQYKLVDGCPFPDYFRSIRSMLGQIKGDVIYASKLRLPSFGVALLKKLSSFRPVVLDIDDLETSWFGEKDWQAPRATLLKNPIGPLHTKLMEKFTWAANDVTTVSTQLQKRYGGVFVPHGKDTQAMDPARFDAAALRREYGVDRFKVIMFLGTPRPHKGLEEVVHAIKKLGRPDIRFVVVGRGSDPGYERRLQELGGEQVMLLDMIPFTDVAKVLSIADLIILPQRRIIQAEGQIPAKIFDAMAMAKPIIATDVSDLSRILDGCGLVVEPGDIDAMAEGIARVFDRADDAEEMGLRAREKCIREYSWDVMESRLAQIMEKYR